MKEILDTPFTQAHERELAWLDYAKWLQKQVDDVVLDERFNLRQVYVPLRAYFEQAVEWPEKPEKIHTRTWAEKHPEKIVVDLTPELEAWVQQADPNDAVRLISGGPGCGKSSFVKVFAAHQAKLTQVTVLFIPLYRLNLHRDLREALNEFAHDDDYLPENPLAQKKSKRLLIIFDGLDEYAIKSKAANEAAQQFVDEVYNVVHQSNYDNTTRLQAIITGRDVAMQANARKFSKSRKTLHILGYYVPDNAHESFQDPNQLLAVDQRDQWWKNYGQATGQNYVQIPAILKSANLVEMTSQPLLNYLVALSYEGGKLDFSAPNNLNRIYRDLLERILEREQEKSPNSPLANMEFGEFFLALKEVALAAWHGDGRTTTVQDIQHYFKQRGLQAFLEVFQDKQQNGVIRLLLAFYFRQTGIRDEDAQRVFEFTHKTFGEYLVACRIVDMVIDIQDEMVSRRKTKPHLAWNENDALQHWITLCGIKPLDRYLFHFICDEMRLQDSEQVHQWQKTLASLIEYMLQYGLPMERLTPRLASYQEETRQARNAEEALLATLNACARVTQKLSKINWPSESAFGEWVYRIQGQSPSVDRVLFVECLSFLDLHACQLGVRNFQGADFFGANLEKANLEGAQLRNACLEQACLKNAHLEDADLMDANLTAANLEGANLNNAYFAGACLEQANLKGATLKETSFYCANLMHTHFEKANLKQADLEGANLEGADFAEAIWTDGKKCSLC